MQGGRGAGGVEATLLQLSRRLLAHGLIVVGLPWSERMRVSGSYYGATAHGAVSEDDRRQAQELGRRVAQMAQRLESGLTLSERLGHLGGG